ncbi:MAG: DNA polymerase ligase N-terminal domain-containing protein [Phycisphaerae bacterium]
MVWQGYGQKNIRFAILKHVRDSDVHWDLLLQNPDHPRLATWQIRIEPVAWQSRAIVAIRLPDHRAVYLDYEGEISSGRGRVTRVDGGLIELLRYDPQRIETVLHGQLLQGALTLIRAADTPTFSDQWTLQWTVTV